MAACKVQFISNIYPIRKTDTSISNGEVQNFGGPVSEEPLVLVNPIFVKFYLFFIFTYCENFVGLAWVVKKF